MRRKRVRNGALLEFLAGIQPSEDCVVWPFGKNAWGYGTVKVDGSMRLAHRVVCERFHGPCPEDKTDAAHNCGNSACVNPAHLRWATAKENQADRVLHGTDSRGEKNGNSKLNREQVLAIRADTRAYKEIAAEYGVGETRVSYIKSRKTWGWL